MEYINRVYILENMSDLRKGISILRDRSGQKHGYATFTEVSPKGPVEIFVTTGGLTPGKHGFHIHRSGNTEKGAKSLCNHYNPKHKEHGDLNSPKAHMGDLGNITANSRGRIKETITATHVKLRGKYSIFGRGLIIHSDEDDLGLGGYPDSLTTGHSGKRVLWGVIAVNDDPCV